MPGIVRNGLNTFLLQKAEKIESKRRESSDKKNYISGKKVREQTELNCDEERDEPNHAKPNHEASIRDDLLYKRGT